MSDFMFLFRGPAGPRPPASPREMEASLQAWRNWLGGIEKQGKLVNAGNPLGPEGKVLKASGVVTDGPYVEIKETLGGFTIVRADSLEEATTLAHGCPMLLFGGNVEIRPIIAF